MFRPHTPWLDDYQCVCPDVAERLRSIGYPQDLPRTGFRVDEEGIHWPAPLDEEAGMLAAPTAAELLAYYLDLYPKQLGEIAVVCAGGEYTATCDGCSARSSTLDDAVGLLLAAKLASA